MKTIILTFGIFSLIACATATNESESSRLSTKDSTNRKIDSFIAAHPDNHLRSISSGTTGNGKLQNGKLMPFKGDNFVYFDEASYLASRAFVHDFVKTSTLSTYKLLQQHYPNHIFTLMECSHEHGGKMHPHHTHQNGLSIDFMVPKLKNGLDNYSLNSLGQIHYLLEFDSNGLYVKVTRISINFDLIAHHLLLLNSEAKKNHLKISKVIFKLNLKDELFNSNYGKELKQSGIYFAQNLTPLINTLHDDHYHVDFEIIP